MIKKVGIIILSLVILCGLSTLSKADVINYSYSTNSVNKNSTDENSEEKKKENYDFGALIMKAIIFGFIVSTVTCVIIGMKHKSVKISKNANEYLDKDSINITNQYDNYINSTTEKERINSK